MSIEDRKKDHLLFSIKDDVESDVSPMFQDVYFVHDAVPEINLDEIELTTVFLEHKFSAPLIVAGMTGGHSLAKKINAAIAEAVEELRLGMGVGSQRAVLLNPNLEETFSIVREKAPTAYIIGNIGASQVVMDLTLKDLERIVEMVEADALAIHLNPLQEAVQLEGEPFYKGFLSKAREIIENCEVPVIAKETGAGISKEAAEKIARTGFSAIDVGGLGGTSFSKVEYYRAMSNGNKELAEISKTFSNWGIPTALSILEVRTATNLPLIATGGIRSGIDIAKALRLGADLVAIGRPVIQAAFSEGSTGVKKYLRKLIRELKITLFLIGARNLTELRRKPIVFSSRMLNWISQRRLKIPL
ncbi:MAG: type 2 isopentenyl-diphosphate Delta-isomerase [Thermoprotei archaeon]|nr:MAG: type 2 isopentenyl-diphosphate Delta-isomerase [Thermoprotei archaeon]